MSVSPEQFQWARMMVNTLYPQGPAIVLHPNRVVSQVDGDIHYIGTHQLLQLYHIGNLKAAEIRRNQHVTEYQQKAIVLHPLPLGNYAATLIHKLMEWANEKDESRRKVAIAQ